MNQAVLCFVSQFRAVSENGTVEIRKAGKVL